MTEASAPKLKHFFNEDLVRSLANTLRQAHPPFDTRRFIKASLKGLEELELTERAWRIADAMHECLPQPFTKAASVLTKTLGDELPSSSEFGMTPFRFLPHVLYVQKHGLDHFEEAMELQYQLTKRFTAEWSIRAYLGKHPKATYARLMEWAHDENVHVRRLVSEGTRPRLPWAPRLKAFQEDPRPVLALLELLKDDGERYVQRSVANNLNDIAKDHPELVVSTCKRWLEDATDARKWIVSHALRSLIKQGHRGALTVMGAGSLPKVTLSKVRLTPSKVRIGDELTFTCGLTSAASRTQELVIDYVVHFVKANGTARPKVFKLKRLVLEPGATVALKGRVSLAPMTTRRPYPGRHAVELMVNGVAHALGEFQVLALGRS